MNTRFLSARALVSAATLAAFVVVGVVPTIAPQSAQAASCVKFVASNFDAPGDDNYMPQLNQEWVRIKNSCGSRTEHQRLEDPGHRQSCLQVRVGYLDRRRRIDHAQERHRQEHRDDQVLAALIRRRLEQRRSESRDPSQLRRLRHELLERVRLSLRPPSSGAHPTIEQDSPRQARCGELPVARLPESRQSFQSSRTNRPSQLRQRRPGRLQHPRHSRPHHRRHCTNTRRDSAPTNLDSPPPIATPAPAGGPTGPTEEAFVTSVTDGDTIRVAIDGLEYRLRYIGIDTPETVDPRRPVEWMGHEASEANKQLVEGKTVVLEKDLSETDRFGRLLRYVWLQDKDGWLMVNEELVRRGFAQASTYPPDVKYTELFMSAQHEARDAGRGLWGDPPSEPEPHGTPPGNGIGGSGCDASYPGVCIPPSPPDLDCGDIPFRRFTVLPPDPHRFDGDPDGIGCESD